MTKQTDINNISFRNMSFSRVGFCLLCYQLYLQYLEECLAHSMLLINICLVNKSHIWYPMIYLLMSTWTEVYFHLSPFSLMRHRLRGFNNRILLLTVLVTEKFKIKALANPLSGETASWFIDICLFCCNLKCRKEGRSFLRSLL